MRYLHTMIRVSNLDQSLHFYCDCLGLKEIRRHDHQKGRFTLVFLAALGDESLAKENQAPLIELTYNWDKEIYSGGRNFGHLAFAVDNIYQTCQSLMDNGIAILRPPRDGKMAFIRSPDGISIELLQAGDHLPTRSPWVDMPNSGEW